MNTEINELEIIYAIVNCGLGSKILHTAKGHGISGGTIFLARGTANNQILKYLGLCDIRKEIVVMVSKKSVVSKVIDILDKVFLFEKPNHGIVFTMPINDVVGIKKLEGTNRNIVEGEIMYHTITVIVDRGKAEQVIDAAVKAGSKGGTIVNGRGSGIHEVSKLFSMEVEPEKEIVLILSESDNTDNIVSSIRKDLEIDKAGNGIIYIQNVNQTFGIHK
ncbi:nitrogen regulatory protein P-II family [Anaerosphaera aminiphila DSM 21120]|uniref:Nitrogen regulatory protein P-II family n=1 Tax=Anaerosphaera aminiphila DSM 21120 TaxID=1120995 RepID=A0A1M5P2H3_9FIRM|nr:P-II family nitrogen regulator [Anaerosphaera aminiphila]SHG95948.1 nitrogen regulatory protein P-II family [Anaerosphaera aminiphila DSM 21120]